MKTATHSWRRGKSVAQLFCSKRILVKLIKGSIDRSARILAERDSFTDEELDFIINCDIKRRMGR